MGIQFFWFYDILLVAIFIGIVLKCARKGFVGTLVSFLAFLVAFCVSLPLSDVISTAIYDNIVEEALVTEMNKAMGETLDGTVVKKLDTIDMSKAKVNGVKLAELTFQPDTAGRISIDLSSLDLSETGIDSIDLSMFGINGDNTDYSSLNAGTLQINQSEFEKYGVEKMVLVSVLVDKMASGTVFGGVCTAVEEMAAAVPYIMGDFSESVASGDQSALKSVVLSILETESGGFAEGIIDSMVKPVLLVPIRALIFLILFVIIIVLLSLIANGLKLVNKIPVIGSLNAFLGAVLGVAESAVTLFLICIGIQVIISLTDNSLIFLNTMTIDNSFLFRHVYYFDFLNLLG